MDDTHNTKSVYIGCSGWSYKDWKGSFYPLNLPLKERLSYYMNFFNTVEINSTFYHLPTQKTVQLWYDQAPKGFQYSLKVNRNITHIKRFKDIREPLHYFYGLSEILREKIGGLLFQFPESFRFTEAKLTRIISHLNENYKNVVEFRHPSWWNTKVIQAFESTNILFCTVNGFSLPEKPIIINNKIYMRFHGNPAYTSLYSDQYLSQWAALLKDASLKEIWVYFNNTCNAYAVQNALQLKKIL